MKNKLVLYLLVSLVASCIYPVTVWAKVNERFSLKMNLYRSKYH